MIFWAIMVVLLDGFITYLVPSYFNNLSLWYPMLSVSLIAILYRYYPLRKYYCMCFIIGIIYDLLYSNIFLYHALLFLVLAKIDSKIFKLIKDNLLVIVLVTILNIVIFDVVGFGLVSLSHYQSLNIGDLVYKITHSLLLNILAVFVYYFLFKKWFSKHKI